jgi:alpha-glucosidase
MRFTTLSGVQPTDNLTGPLHFQGQSGEQVRIDVLAGDLVRVRHYPDGTPRLDRTWMVVDAAGEMPREGRSRADLSPFPCPACTTQQINPDTLRVQTADLQITIRLGEFALQWADTAGNTFAADLERIGYGYNRAGREVFHYLKRHPGEIYYGFGERAGALNKAGQRMRMVDMDTFGYNAETSDPLYKHFPFYITYLPDLNIAYGLFYDNLATTIFDMGKEIDGFRGDYRYYQALDGDLDYTLIYGPTIPDVIEKFTALTGRPTLPPRWSLGYLGSTMKYTEAPDAQEQLKQFAQLCQQHDIPCDLFHLSSGYSLNEQGQRCVFTWNRGRIPDPQGMVDNFHAAGIRLAPNIKPYLLTTHPKYAEVAQRGGFIRDAESDTPQISTFWSGGAGESSDGSYLDFSSEAGYAWWQEQATAQLLDYGIDALWNDNNEFEIWDDAARCAGFGQGDIPIALARPLQTLLMAHASYHALTQYRPNQRPFLLSRSGCPGIQRYAQTWSGDNTTSWNDLRYNIPMGLSMGLSGAPNCGHDVGGFFGPKPEPELLLRWVQNGIFQPRFCIHSWNSDGSVTEPWMYPEVLPAIREAIHFRYRLIPYLYSLLFEAAHTGHPITRPMVYHFPHDPHCLTESFDFMLGPFLLVASVLDEKAGTRAIYLPKQANWCDFYSGEWYTGNQTVTLAAPLERIPLLVRAGGIIPMGKTMRYTGEQADDLRQIYLFPHPEQGSSVFDLIEDDGLSLDYQRGGYTAVHIELTAQPDHISVSVSLTPGYYTLPYDELEFILPEGEARPIHITGAAGIRETTFAKRRRVSVPTNSLHIT